MKNQLQARRQRIRSRHRRGVTALNVVCMLVLILVIIQFGIHAVAVTYGESYQVLVTWFESP